MNFCKKGICALLSVLMVVCLLPFAALPAAAMTVDPTADPTKEEYNTYLYYDDENERIANMTEYFNNGVYALYCDETLGVVAYRNLATGEALFTNPWDMSAEKNTDASVRIQESAQIIMTYLDSSNNAKAYNSYQHAALKNQITVKSIKNGVRVEYAIGDRSSRVLCPMMIEQSALEEKIYAPLQAVLSTRDFNRFKAFFNDTYFYKYHAEKNNTDRMEMIAQLCPVSKQKNINVYTLDVNTSATNKRWIESLILEYCPDYSFEEMDNDYDYVNYVEEAISPPLFQMALEYVIDGGTLSVTMPANGIRYDETAYRITELQVLPYMGACNKANEGYTFIPDGSGALYALNTPAQTANRVYGEDYSLFSKVSGLHNETIRMPVFGQVETAVNETTGVATSRGYLAIIEDGAALASIAPNHQSYIQYSAVTLTFITRQNDTSRSGWSVYANRRYTDDYKLRYILLTDDAHAAAAGLSSYYECSWMGMAAAYRDYLDETMEGFDRLGENDVKQDVPLYIETFGCVDTVKKIASMPVTVSVALTSFDDVETMYRYLAENGVGNVNFKLKGYANGGYYADTPYKLKWERTAGGKSGLKDLLKVAAEEGFGVYPDFDFVYTSRGDGGRSVNMKKNAARTIDNRYTTKRVYSATQQALVSYYQMVLSPATYSKFYEKMGKKYGKLKNVSGISLATLGSALNSDYDENKTVLREEAKDYVVAALGYFKAKDLDIMIEGGNAFTWGYADHILNVPLDSSRYTTEYSSVPFMGVVLHGYVQFAGSALNMEGDLRYAMLKAMENGASAYFILSYANTQLLKEDVLLSQNYSVRYDIWQTRLVEIYKELNAVLFDVQTKLIIGHRSLAGTRVPDEDELLADIAEAAEQTAARIAAEIEAKRLAEVAELLSARTAAVQAVETLTAENTSLGQRLVAIHQQRVPYATGEKRLAAAWARSRAENDASHIRSALLSYVIRPYVNVRPIVEDAATQVLSAKEAYDTLVARNANAQLQDAAKEKLCDAIDLYITIVGRFETVSYVLNAADRDAYVNDHTLDYDIDLLRALFVASPALTVAAADLDVYLLGRTTLDALGAAVVAAKEAYDADTTDAAKEQALDDALTAYGSKINDYATAYGAAAPALNNAAYKAGDESALSALVDTDALNAFIANVYTAVNTTYQNIGIQALFNAYCDLLEADGFYDPADPEGSAVNVNALIAQVESENAVEEPAAPEPAAPEGEEATVNGSKYSLDNSIVYVTYGEKGAPFKSILLNFNDYAVQTTVDGVTYTLEGYGYIVIYH